PAARAAAGRPGRVVRPLGRHDAVSRQRRDRGGVERGGGVMNGGRLLAEHGDALGRCLPSIATDIAAWRRQACGPRHTLRFTLGAHAWRLRFVDAPAPQAPLAAWHIQLGASRGWLSLDTAAAQGDWDCATLDPAFVQALLLE